MSESRYRLLVKRPSPQQPGTKSQLHTLKATPKLKILKFIGPEKFSSVFIVKARPNLWSSHRTFKVRQLSQQEKPKEQLPKNKPIGMRESTAAAIKLLSHTAQIWAWELTGNVIKIKAWLETLDRDDIFFQQTAAWESLLRLSTKKDKTGDQARTAIKTIIVKSPEFHADALIFARSASSKHWTPLRKLNFQGKCELRMILYDLAVKKHSLNPVAHAELMQGLSSLVDKIPDDSPKHLSTALAWVTKIPCSDKQKAQLLVKALAQAIQDREQLETTFSREKTFIEFHFDLYLRYQIMLQVPAILGEISQSLLPTLAATVASETVKTRGDGHHHVEQDLPAIATRTRALIHLANLKEGTIIYHLVPSGDSVKIDRLRDIASKVSAALEEPIERHSRLPYFRDQVHNHFSEDVIALFNQKIRQCQIEERADTLQILIEGRALALDILYPTFETRAFTSILSLALTKEIAWPTHETPTLAEIGTLAISIRHAFEKHAKTLSADDRYGLIHMAIALNNTAFGLCVCDKTAHDGNAEQAQKMTALIRVLSANGFGNEGTLRVAGRIEALATQWNSLEPETRILILRTEGALVAAMLEDYQRSFRAIFSPMMRDFGDQLGTPLLLTGSRLSLSPEHRASFSSQQFRATGVMNLQVHLAHLKVEGGNEKTAKKIMALLAKDSVPVPYQAYHLDELEFPSDPRMMGNKALSLNYLSHHLPENTPRGFVLPARAANFKLGELEKKMIRQALSQLEVKCGEKLGAGLKLSVRSGAAVSMPGAMDTLLNLESIDDIFQAIETVYASWDSPKARAEREKEGIPDEWGSAVTLMEMVDGTRQDGLSGSGIAASGKIPAYGMGVRGDKLVNVDNAGTNTLNTDAAKTLADAMTLFEDDWQCPVEVEFTIESGKVYFLQIREAHLTREQEISWYANRMRQGKLTKEQAVALLDRQKLEDDKIITRLEQTQVQPLATKTRFGEGVPISGRVALTANDVTSINLGVRKAVFIPQQPNSPNSVMAAMKAGAFITEGGNALAHIFDVARDSGVSFVGGIALDFDEGTVTIAGTRFKVGDVITVDPTHRAIYAQTIGTITGPSPVLNDIEFLLK